MKLPYLLSIAAALCLSANSAAQSTPGSAEREAAIRVVTRWDAPWYEHCDGGTRDDWDDMIIAWYKEITNAAVVPTGHGGQAFTASGSKVNGSIEDPDFTDWWRNAWGNDSANIRPDDVDAYMWGMHGSMSFFNNYLGRVRKNSAFVSGDCDSSAGEMLFGNTDLEFLHISSCHSMTKAEWVNWWRSFGGAHQIDGFHGYMWIWSVYAPRYRDFADDAFTISIKDSWLDHMYIWHVSGNDDQCPVAYAVGSSANDSWTRGNTERYNWVYNDPATNWYTVWWISGCDPAGAGKLD